jgi:hypothetical protein
MNNTTIASDIPKSPKPQRDLNRNPNKKKTGWYVEHALCDELADRAKELGMSQGKLIEEILSHWLSH